MDDQKLFNHMADEHGLLLLDSQMREIIDIVLEMHNEKPETCTMKTAMQELIDDLKEFRHEQTSPLVISTMNKVLLKASLLTTKEKEQIVNAYKEGCSDSILDESTDEERAEQYYKETYTNPDRDENGRIWIFYISWGISGEKQTLTSAKVITAGKYRQAIRWRN